jgi:hypothetical protein
MSTNDAITKSLLNYDPIAEAEKLYPGSDIGALLLVYHSATRTNEHLQKIGDSCHLSPFDDMIALVESEGFVQIYETCFVDDLHDGHEHTERFLVFFKADEGIIITLESYRGRVNGANMYYNIDLKPDGYNNGCTYSGHFFFNPDGTYSVYIGLHDIREGFRYKLNTLRSNGKFLAKWIERPFLWFLTYMDTKGSYDYKAMNANVIAQFPQNVIDAISPNKV